MKNQVFTLVSNVVLLKSEEQCEPIEEVHVGKPLVVRRLAETSDGAESGGGCAYLGVTEGRMVGKEVVDRNYIVRLLFVGLVVVAGPG